MRIRGLGGEVVARAGGTVVLTPGSEIYAALERGVIDTRRMVGLVRGHWDCPNRCR